VIQTGKWRKQITLPSVPACATTAISDTATGTAKLLRLPAKSSEGDMPLIAFTSGCDPAECFLLNTVGIDPSEFVAPNSPLPAAFPTVTPGAGHVQFFTGNDETAMGGTNANPAPASAVTGGNTAADTYTWWETYKPNLSQFDIIFNACECKPYDRGATAYAAMDSFLNGGGRLFTTHYYYNWFTPFPPASADIGGAVNWNIPATNAMHIQSETDSIDQTFPKGAAFATWLQDNAITTTKGSITLADVRTDIAGLEPAGCSEAMGTCRSTQWIYEPMSSDPRYVSFNTPVASPVAEQCGKAVFSDVHLSGTSNDATFPMECSNPNIDTPPGHGINEKALMFLFFDLSSCVQSSMQQQVSPPAK
jgi:hypothetical protein